MLETAPAARKLTLPGPAAAIRPNDAGAATKGGPQNMPTFDPQIATSMSLSGLGSLAVVAVGADTPEFARAERAALSPAIRESGSVARFSVVPAMRGKRDSGIGSDVRADVIEAAALQSALSRSVVIRGEIRVASREQDARGGDRAPCGSRVPGVARVTGAWRRRRPVVRGAAGSGWRPSWRGG